MSEYATIEYYVNQVIGEITKRDVEQVSEKLRALGWEEVVRCRDCKHYNEKTYEWVNCWTRTYTTCSMFDGCRVEPDGYCKWGERRDA